MLKALELVGFKSFADRTRFDFPPGITAVVGPNGSGKSNIVDAIKWVLGEQSVKTLRGKEMADVIFNGSASRPPIHFAETTLILDNGKRLLPIDTPEVLVTRRVYRNGEGEYLINRQACRLRDIRELFSGTGVATEAYSVIEQGKVDILLQSSPRERRLIFEEAAGISRFKAKKVESLRRLERVEQNLLRLGDIVAEVEHRLRQVRLQAGKARRYQEYTGRLQQLRTHVALVDWRQLGEQISTLDAEIERLAADRDSTMAEVDRAEQAASAAESQIDELGGAISDSESSASRVRESIASREAAIEHEHLRAAEWEKETARLRRQLAAVSVRAGGLQQQLEENTASLAEAEEDYARVASEAAECDRELAGVSAKLDTMRRDSEQSRLAYLSEMRRASQWESESSAMTARMESTRARRHEREREAAALTATAAEIGSQLDAIVCDEAALLAALDEGQCTEKLSQSRLKELRERQRKLQSVIDQTREPHAAASARSALLTELEERREGFSAAVKEVLQHAKQHPEGPFRHVRGVVAELLQVSVEMVPLVEAALGERAQQVVVTSIDELIESSRRHPQHFEGQVTFTPLDDRTSRGAARDADLHGQDGVVGRADEFVQTAPQFVPLARRLLGRTWIVDTLQRATDLARLHDASNFVTLAGEVLSVDGTVAFGPCQPASGLLSRRSELRVLDQQVADLEGEIEQRRIEASSLQGEIVEARSEVESLAADRERRTTELAGVRPRITACRERCVRLDDELRRCREDMAACSEAIESATASIRSNIERLEASKATLAILEQEATRFNEAAATLASERTSVESTTIAVRVELAKCEERVANLRLRGRQIEQDQRERQRTVDEVRAELSQCIERFALAERAILTAESELALLYLDKEQLQITTANLLSQRELLRVERTSSAADAQRLRAAVHAIEEDLHARELGAHEVRLARTSLVDRLREDYGIELGELTVQEDDPRERESIDQEIADLRRKISHIGNVNLDALAELEELEARFTSLSNQFQDLSDAKHSLVQIIERINADSRRLFAETLECVRGYFQSLFRKLFGGGQADIVLDEGVDLLESGIEIIARPPGKEPRNISLLSGGEKTLTCVALLLAIFQYRPSPFCVLDEVDAALDEANIERFIAVLQEFLTWTQFIVVTHSKKTMTCATTLYGVTMQESGVSKRVSVRFEDVTADGHIHASATEGESDASDDETQAA